MEVSTFATKHRLKTSTDKDDGTTIVSGKNGHLYEYSPSELGVCFLTGRWCPKTWGNFRRKAESIGMLVRQNGDSEGCISFDPADREQSKLAIKIAGARPKRVLSAEAKAKLLLASQKYRFVPRGTVVEGHLGV